MYEEINSKNRSVSRQHYVTLELSYKHEFYGGVFFLEKGCYGNQVIGCKTFKEVMAFFDLFRNHGT